MGCVLVNDDFRDFLQNEGLLDIDSIIRRDDVENVKSLLAERQTFRITASNGTVLYIKHYPKAARDSFWTLPGAQRFSSPAAREYTALLRLRDLGIAAPIPVACLEESLRGRFLRAALITIGLPASVTLESWVRDPGVSAGRRVRFARTLGRLARAMHDGGVNHRDLYFVHILVGDGDRIFVVDLNRADLRRRVGRRWRVKDLAALLQSAPPEVTLREKIVFARAYFAAPLRPQRRFLRSVKTKAASMKARTLKRVFQGRPNYHGAG